MMKQYVFDLKLTDWYEWMAQNGQPRFRADQLFDWLYVKRVDRFEEMTNLPKALIEKLNEAFEFVALNEIARYESKDGTIKFLYELSDKNAIETVVMKHEYGNSICVTT